MYMTGPLETGRNEKLVSITRALEKQTQINRNNEKETTKIIRSADRTT